MPTQTRALHGALQYAMLPAQRQILRGERRTWRQECAERDDDNVHDAHSYASVRDV